MVSLACHNAFRLGSSKPHITRFKGRWVMNPHPIWEGTEVQMIQHYYSAMDFVKRLNKREK